ncbi:discoidin domain-containing protein [Myxococcus sp. K38C18041901]|uniref:discoidin domain-containing protein n=1 Tax=Myxococcus guangdongensis TaxID=2906760 RepID=UPI0020A811FB|nr:discoidin domain-containing protein [Myxococcus guangdongensis]MCP3064034.1 discoidin domain-containing protein [Myxococcus guangdongensis]
MHRPMSFNSLFLASALTLAFVPGCQDAPSPIDPTPEPLGTVSQGLACGGSLIPVMSARDNPVSGLVIASSEASASNPAWHAVDGSDSTMWLTASGQSTAWLTYEFFDGPRTLSHYAIKFSNGSLTNRAPRDWTLQGWSGSAWNTLDTRTLQTNWGGAEEREFSITTPGAYRKYRLMVTEDNTAGTGVDVLSIGRLSFYNCACATIVNQVPVMTSATAPSGTVAGSGFLQAGNEPWKAFDNVDTSASMWLSSKATPSWLSYEWPGAARILTRYAIKFPNGEAVTRAPKNWTLQAWNGSSWVVVDTRVDEFNWTSAERREYPLSVPRTFTRFKLDITDDNDPRTGVETVSIARLEFLGCERDTVPPIVPTFSGFTPTSPGTQTAVTLNGATEANATVRLFSGGTCAGSAIASFTATSAGAFSRALTVTANATSTFSAKAEDSAGNVSACSAAVSYTHDNVVPATPFQLAFVPSATGTTLTPQLTGRTEASALVRLFLGPTCGGAPLTTTPANATTGAFSFTPTVTANAVTSFSLRAVDAAGNVSVCSASVSFSHDTVAPAAPTFTAGMVPLSQSPIVAGIRVQAEPRSRLFLFMNDGCLDPVSAEVAVDSSGNALVPLTASQVGVPASIRIQDPAGNLSPCVSVEERCFAGFLDCDGNLTNGCETPVMDDPANCGACGTVCGGAASASGVCGAGTCGLACAVGTFDCDGSPLNGCESSTACAPGVCQVSPDRELLITALPVVEDPVRTTNGGVWTFGTLLRRMNGGQNPSEMVRTWLKTWETNQVIAGLPVAARSRILPDVLTPWETRSGGPSAPLDFDTAPFRLLAIVNRIDLRSEGAHSGEGRFVFGVTTPSGQDLPFTVILEYMLPGDGPEDIQRWARDWHELGSLPLGSPAYNTKLQAITDRFTQPFIAQGRFMGSAIHQVRTNENALNPLWELREFHFGPSGLVPAPVALTPELSLNGSPRLESFVQENAAAILAGTHEVPSLYQGQAFVAGSAITPFGLAWFVPGADPEVRHRFSLNTCNGCHAGETQTPFLHVFPRPAGAPSFLSPFLLGTQSVPDPLTGMPRVFDDLGRRDEDLETLVCGAPQSLAPSLGAVGEGLLTPRSLSGSMAPKPAAVPGFPPRSNLPPGRVH